MGGGGAYCICIKTFYSFPFQLFQAGLKTYIQTFKYANASTKDLWVALETTGVGNLTEMMSLWTRNIGYPVLSTRLIHAPDGTYSIALKQRRFLSDSCPAEANGEIVVL